MMDIPETGAIFTLGKSHLAENSQSYFFIKNDPVQRLVSGPGQSAVICESGRLFVWGENQFGQLGLGNSNTNEIITKPTCLKSMKALGLKICDVAFGVGWSVILTHSNDVFFTGRNFFHKNTRIHDTKNDIIRKPLRLVEFDEMIQDGGQKDEIFERISAGDEHFIVLTSHGRLFAWGNNESNQLGLPESFYPQPIEILLNNKIKMVTCGPKSTLILNDQNQIFLAGQLNDYHFEKFTELSSQDHTMDIAFLCISKANEIFLTTENGSIFRGAASTRNKTFTFQKFYDYDNEDYGPVRKLLKGSSFYAALTKANKFFTTFSESGHHLKTFREISKFKNLRTLDAAVGDGHILVLGIPKGSDLARKLSDNQAEYNSVPDLNGNNVLAKIDNVEAIKPEENESIRPNTPVEMDRIEEEETRIEENGNDQETNLEVTVENQAEEIQDINEEHCKIIETVADIENISNHLLEETNEVTDEILSTVSPDKGNNDDSTVETLQDSVDETEKHQEDHKMVDDESLHLTNGDAIIENGTDEIGASFNKSEDSSSTDDISKSPASTFSTSTIKLAPLKVVPKVSTSNNTPNGSVRSIKFDEKSLKSQKSSERLIRPRTPYPEGTPQQTLKQIAQSDKSDLEEEDDLIDRTSPDFADSLENTPKPESAANRDGGSNAKNGVSDDYPSKLKSTSDKIEEIITTKSSEHASYIIKQRYTDENLSKHLHGKKVVNDNDAGGDEELDDDDDDDDEELEVEIQSKIDPNEIRIDEIRFINDGVDVTENVAKTLASQTTDFIRGEAKNEQKLMENLNHNKTVLIDGITNGIDDIIQTPDNSDESKLKTLSNIEDDERTTASVNSNKTAGNPFENDLDENCDNLEPNKNIIESGGKGRKKVKRFLNGIKNTGKGMSCRTNKSVKVEDVDEPPKYTPVDEHLEEKTSKVCTIL